MSKSALHELSDLGQAPDHARAVSVAARIQQVHERGGLRVSVPHCGMGLR